MPCYTERMRAAAVIALLASACGAESGSLPKLSDAPDSSRQPSAAETLHDQLAAFFPLDESGDGARMDRVNGVELTPWQRTGWGAYAVDASGTRAVPAQVGDGQHILGASGYHFATYHAPALEHASGSFTWAGWLALDGSESEAAQLTNQTWLAKWGGVPDTLNAPIDHREYRIYYDAASSRFRFEVSADGLEGPGHSQRVTHPLPIERERWYFLQASHDAASGRVDLRVGTQAELGTIESAPWQQGVFSGWADLDVGAENTCTDDHLQGKVDALGYWTRVLTDGESQALWNDGAGREL